MVWCVPVAQMDRFFDPRSGGWGRAKNPLAAPVELTFHRASHVGMAHEDDARRLQMEALFSVDAYTALIDPVWGGVAKTGRSWAAGYSGKAALPPGRHVVQPG